MQPQRDVAAILPACMPLSALKSSNFGKIIEAIGGAQVVLIGEASHGTEEFYRERAALTRELIAHHGFNIVAVEADWPDAYRLNRYVTDDKSTDRSANDALGDFKRFPRWMWRNHVVAEFAEWLKEHNKSKEYAERAKFAGLDLYSMYTSINKVVEFLTAVDKPLARLAKQRYATLGYFKDEPSEYAIALRTGMVESQRDNVVRMLVDLQARSAEYVKKTVGFAEGDEPWVAQMNARLVKDSEKYYRNMFEGHVQTWNIRDSHMCDTLQELIKHYEAHLEQARQGKHDEAAAEDASPAALQASQSQSQHPRRARAVVWAHNSHIGDASKTSHKLHGEYNIGQLCRERFGLTNTFNIGFSTNTGTVSAAKAWGGQRHTMDVNPGMAGSSEELHHRVFQAFTAQSRSAAAATAAASTASGVRGGPLGKADEVLAAAAFGGGSPGAGAGAAGAAGAGAASSPPTAAGASAGERKAGEQQQQQAQQMQPAENETGHAIITRSNSDKVKINAEAVAMLSKPRIQRYIGVQYVKHRERSAHYIESAQGAQYDAVVHIDVTSALRPLDGGFGDGAAATGAAAMDEDDD